MTAPPHIIERFVKGATLIFDVEDKFARDRGLQGAHPRPMGRLRFMLVGEMNGGNRTNYPAPWELLVTAGASGYHVWFDRAVPPFQKVSIRKTYPNGTYIVQVLSDYYRPQENAGIVIPMADPNDPTSGAPYTFALEPGYAYPFPATFPVRPIQPSANCGTSPVTGQFGPTLLRGSLHGAQGKPIPGVKVEALGVPSAYMTDASGQWVLVFPDTQTTGPVTVRFTLPNAQVVDVANVCVFQGGETSLAEKYLPNAITLYVVT